MIHPFHSIWDLSSWFPVGTCSLCGQAIANAESKRIGDRFDPKCRPTSTNLIIYSGPKIFRLRKKGVILRILQETQSICRK